jgi:hypothetical protein
MRSMLHMSVVASVLLFCGCGPAPVPAPVAAPPAPPPPPPVAAPPPPVQPVAEAPAAKPQPPTLPPELIAKADALVAVIKQAQADAAKAAANPGDALDAAVGGLEQQAKLVTLGNEIAALASQLTPEQQVEFSRRYQSQFSGLIPTQLPTTAPPVDSPPAP